MSSWGYSVAGLVTSRLAFTDNARPSGISNRHGCQWWGIGESFNMPLVGLNGEKSPCMAATAALLKDHLVETFTSGLQRSVASLKSIDLEYVGNNIGVGAGRQ